MQIIVGSKNQAKVSAVENAILDYPVFQGAQVSGVDVSSDVPEQPKGLEEIILGAKNRARKAYESAQSGARLGFGLESGLMPAPHTKTGYMDICACAVYDGKSFASGLSAGFECPVEITRLVMEDGLDLAQACNVSGLTEDPKIGSKQGAIGILTHGRVDRRAYSIQAITMALIQLENPQLY